MIDIYTFSTFIAISEFPKEIIYEFTIMYIAMKKQQILDTDLNRFFSKVECKRCKQVISDIKNFLYDRFSDISSTCWYKLQDHLHNLGTLVFLLDTYQLGYTYTINMIYHQTVISNLIYIPHVNIITNNALDDDEYGDELEALLNESAMIKLK